MDLNKPTFKPFSIYSMLLTKPCARSRKPDEITTPPIRLFTIVGIIEIAVFGATLCAMVKDLTRTSD